MNITKLDKCNDKSFKLYLDDEYYGLVYFGDIKKMSLILNSKIEESTINLIDKLFYKRAFNKSIKLLSRREMCTYDIKNKLIDKGYNQRIIDRVINNLKSLGYIDDKRYATIYVELKVSRKGLKLINRELINKEIDKDIIEQVILEFINFNGDESNSIDKKTINKILSTRYNNINIKDSKEINKMYNYMLRRGFSYEDVKKCINEVSNL